ncbi:TonB-dependent siderophore receptor [Nitrosomonas sp. H1_AOB3]|uniref:TonB-dependent siderophore receptor n=1 Tax=Nitrosomonas sp. H1_AOB3 TaxID=2741553 RepID=UPI001937FA49|nr:TonB-dependent siderophore receptor [Nitrosomonas sp. H1_AOB3]QOJ10028.1 MAG: TonB-dependent siderophore receptor [Nitrosomonas sp. H1_AOB3]
MKESSITLLWILLGIALSNPLFGAEEDRVVKKKRDVRIEEGQAARDVETAVSTGPVTQLPAVAVRSTSVYPETRGYTTNRADSLIRTDLPLSDIPASIQVVPHEVLRDRAVTQPNQLLENVSGVRAEASYGGNRGMFFNIRGFTTHSSSRDGFQYNGNLVTRDVQNIEQIEVMKGPSGAIYGGIGSLGGQVNTVSKRPLYYNYGAINLLWGNYQQWRPTFDINRVLGKGFSVRLNGAYENNRTFRDGGGFESYSLAPAISWQGERTSVTLLTEYNRLEQDLFDFGLPNLTNYRHLSRTRYFGLRNGDHPGLPGDYGLNETYVGTAILHHQLSQAWNLRIAAQYHRATQDSTQSFPDNYLYTGDNKLHFTNYSNGHEWSRGHTVQAELRGQAHTWGFEHNLLFGTEYRNVTNGFNNTDQTGFVLDLFDPGMRPAHHEPIILGEGYNEGRGDDIGIYAQDLLTLTSAVKLLAGLRLDRFHNEAESSGYTNSANQMTLSWQVGAVWELNPTAALFTRVGRSHSPNITRSIDASVFDAEVGTQKEIGVKFNFFERRLNATLAAYKLTRSNVLTSDPNDPQRSILAGSQSSHGFELDVNGELTRRWKVIASYAYTHAEVKADGFFPVGDKLPDVPRHSGNLWTTYEPGGVLQGLGVGGGIYAASSRQATLPNSHKLGAYVRMDTTAYYDTGNWRAQFNVNNLFDTKYYYSGASGVYNYTLIPNPPRTFLLTLSYRL